MIPRELLLLLSVIASITNVLAARVSWRRGRKAMGWALMSFSFAAFGAVTFYTAAIFFGLTGEPAITWSRWVAFTTQAVFIIASIAVYILNKDG